MSNLLRITCVLAVIANPLYAHADEPFRCGKWIVSSELTLDELTAKCGQPSTRNSNTQDVMVRNPNTGLVRKTGESTIETWIYNRGTRAAAMVVTIVDGKIKNIERQKS
jgi:hypothetical protein